MKRLTVAAAAFAAGMLTIVAHSQAESDRFLSRLTAPTTDKAKTPTKKADASKPKKGENKTKTASAQSKRNKAGPAKRGAGEANIDIQKTASITRVRPDLKAKARKSVIELGGIAERKFDGKVTNAAGYTILVSHYAATYGVPSSLAHAVIRVESNYRPNVRGSAGEIGLMQIKPSTARAMGYSGSSKGLFNPETNIKYGMKYLGLAHQLSGGSTCGTILRYNAGHGARRMNPVSAAYCSKVKNLL